MITNPKLLGKILWYLCLKADEVSYTKTIRDLQITDYKEFGELVQSMREAEMINVNEINYPRIILNLREPYRTELNEILLACRKITSK
jgi:hypothetical protein